MINHFKPSPSLWQNVHKLLRPDGKVFLCSFNKMQNTHFDFPIDYCLSKEEFYATNPGLICEHYENFNEPEKFLDGSIFGLADRRIRLD